LGAARLRSTGPFHNCGFDGMAGGEAPNGSTGAGAVAGGA
jgi:hypothetical protein